MELEKIKEELKEAKDYFVAERGKRHFGLKQEVSDIKLRFPVSMEKIQNATKYLNEQGYVILPNTFTTSEMDHLKTTLEPLWASTGGGKTNFHGFTTKRVHALPSKLNADDLTLILANHNILSVLDQFLPQNYLVNDAQAVKTAPRETVQPLHFDNSVYGLIHRRLPDFPPFSIAVLIALEDITVVNGATRVIPQSHLWLDTVPDNFEMKHIELKKGDVALWSGNIYHSAGANQSDDYRYAILLVYSNPYLRPLENYTLTPVPRLKQLSPIVLSLLGFSVVPPYVGSVDAQSPIVYLQSNL